MRKKLTITLDKNVYLGLHSVIGERKISKFIENLVKPYVADRALVLAYQNMAKDCQAEQEALDWVEGLIGND